MVAMLQETGTWPEQPVALLIEPGPTTIEALRYFLSRAGLAVIVARSLDEAAIAQEREVSVRVLDRTRASGSMAGLDRFVRSSAAPLIVLAPSCDELLPNAGQVLPFPITARRLAAKIDTALESSNGRRRRGYGEILRAGPVVQDTLRHEVLVRDAPVSLRLKEFDLLEAFLRRSDEVLSRAFLLAVAWGLGTDPPSNTLDVHVWRLRQKVELDPGHPRHLLTMRGRGYRFAPHLAGSDRDSKALGG